MANLIELEKAKKDAVNLETLINWKSLMQYMTVLGCAMVNGEPRRFYKNRIGHYYYRVVSESELHRDK